jgi:hypothetical protein
MRIMGLFSNTSRLGPFGHCRVMGTVVQKPFAQRMNKDANVAVSLRPSHDSSSNLDMHQSFHKSVEVENLVKRSCLDSAVIADGQSTP